MFGEDLPVYLEKTRVTNELSREIMNIRTTEKIQQNQLCDIAMFRSWKTQNT